MPWERHTPRVVDRCSGERILWMADKFLVVEKTPLLKEVNGNKEDHQNKNDNRNHEERESHNKTDTPFVTMSDVVDLLKQERERPPKEPRHFVRRPLYPMELLKEPYPEKYDTPTFALFDGRKGSTTEHISKFLDSMGPFAAYGDLCLREFSKSLVDKAYTWDKKNLLQTLTVSTTATASGTKRKNSTEKVIKLPKITKQPTAEKQKDPKYCRYHRYVHHPTVDRRTLKWEVNHKIQDGTLQLSEEQQKVHKIPFPNYKKDKNKAVVSVVIHGNVSDMELGFGPEARNAAMEALITIAAESGATFFTAEAHANRVFLETMNTITFTDEDMEVQYLDQRRPLYLSAEDIKDDLEVDLRELLERKKKRKECEVEPGSPPQCVRVQLPNGRTENSEEVVVDQAESTAETRNSEEVVVDQTKSMAVKEEKSTIAEPKMTAKEELEDYDEMPGIDPGLVAHSLNVEPGTRPVVQPMRTFHTEVEAQITQEVKKLLTAGFIKPIQHPRWLPVKNKNGQIRYCVDFRNLNKACPKDEFPLPNMDLLIDSTAGHAMFSFMDGFSGYNQIRMSTKDAEKTAFRTPIGNFYYTVIPFGLKNAGATYQRTMTAMFHDMMHKEIEDYVNDIVLKMNPLKCAFGVSAGKFLGFLVHNRGIDVDLAKAFAIATMKAPTSHKELKSFLGRLSYIRRFNPGLAVVTAVFTPLMKKGVPFVWSTACQQAFEKIQAIMTKLPTVCASVAGRPLRLYLASNNEAIGGLIAQEDEDGTEKPVYYVSCALRDAETRYSGAERACLALIYASQRLWHYFLAHKVQLMTKSHPIRSLLHKPVLSDLLAQFPGEDSSSTSHEVPGGVGEALLADLINSVWTLKVDGFATSNSSGASIVLIREDGETIAKSFKLDFLCSNNTSEYEAYITGLAIAHEMGIKHLRVIGDSNLVSHAMRCGNCYADALATLGSQISFEGPKVDVTINKRNTPITDLLKEEFEEQCLDAEDWRTPIKAKLMSPEGVTDLKTLKDYVLIAGDLYRRLPGGVLARCVSLQEAAKKLTEVHERSYEFRDGVSLYRRLQRLGYFWPNMSKEAANLQEQCSFCQHQNESDQVYVTFISSDWRTPFLEYLIENVLLQTSKAVIRLKKLATRYFMEGGILFRKGFHGDPLRCLSLAESQTVMKEAHSGECGEHQEHGNTMAFPHLGARSHWPNQFTFRWIHWILVATEYFSKWVEAILLRKAIGAVMANFIREHIITRFDIPHKIISDNGTPFVNKSVRKVLEHYRIKHRRSTPYYPQGNGQAEATNRMLLRILSKMVFDYGKGWSSHLADTLWAYRGSTKTAIGFTPFSLVYDTDAIAPTELLVHSPRILHGMDVEADVDIYAEARVVDLESLEEARELAQVRSLRYHQKLANAYEKMLQTRIFAKGQMVLKTVDHVRRGLPSPSKFAPNWEGPYLIREAYDSGSCKLSTADGIILADPINGK
uniref:Integrase catalytic domain-containing protein n=1 Tax=Fagus sylvatica TaxID=28930 RepID=A0A2N9FFG8_FAGSY